jgi:hypothetical protein
MTNSEIERQRIALVEAGYYTDEQINRMCELERQYNAECEEIAQKCSEEGYPSHGSNYDLRCANIRKYYDEQIALLDY